MKFLYLLSCLIFPSLQAAVPEAVDASEMAFPDGEVEEVEGRQYEEYDPYGYVEYGFPYYLCQCSFEEYEDYWGEASVDADTAETAWCPCFQYDEYEGEEYAYETKWPGQAAARSLDRKKKHHAGRSLDRKKKSKKHHH